MSAFVDFIKLNATAITAIFTTIATIGGAALYVQNNYASASEVKAIAKNQEQQYKLQSAQQRQLMLFQLEYYDDKIKKLQEEKRAAEQNAARARRTPSEVQEEIVDIKTRRDLTRKSLEQ
jgi:sensor histidine kinase YesM